MPYRDPEKHRAYMREYRRRHKEGFGKRTPEANPVTVNPVSLKDAESILGILEEQTNAVRAANTDALTRARCVGYLAGVSLKAVELSEYGKKIQEQDARLRALEERIEDGSNIIPA